MSLPAVSSCIRMVSTWKCSVINDVDLLCHFPGPKAFSSDCSEEVYAMCLLLQKCPYWHDNFQNIFQLPWIKVKNYVFIHLSVINTIIHLIMEVLVKRENSCSQMQWYWVTWKPSLELWSVSLFAVGVLTLQGPPFLLPSLQSTDSPPIQGTLLLAEDIMERRLEILPVLMEITLLEEIEIFNYWFLLFSFQLF